MKTIGFVRGKKSYLPEIEAYKDYFKEYAFVEVRSINELSIESVDLIWMFMGINFKKYDLPIIHEYASMSLPPFAQCKDYIKSKINVRPNLRIFLNENIKTNFKFNDEVKYCYRDMGVDDIFFYNISKKIQYDCVYVGSMSKDRELHFLLDKFKKNPDRSILMVGEPPADLYIEYKKYKNIIFTGQIRYRDVPQYITQARYAVNYMPNKFPFNIQTSTKLLEYVALGMDIITTNYKWVDEFEKVRGMKFFHISKDCSELDFDKIDKYNFYTKNIKDLSWSNILSRSGIQSRLKRII